MPPITWTQFFGGWGCVVLISAFILWCKWAGQSDGKEHGPRL